MTSDTAATRRRLAFVTDIVTPYTIAVMGELSVLTDLTVLFSTVNSGRGQDWTFSELPFRHVVVGGLSRQRAQADLSDYYYSPRTLLELGRCSPDAIITAGWSFPSYYAALYAKACGRALLIHSDGNSHTEQSLSALQRLSRRILVPCADGFAANTVLSAAWFRELGAQPERVYPTPHSTNLAPFWNLERSYDRPDDALRVLGMGRLLARKGFDRLIAAFADARASDPRLVLRLVGSGPEHDRLHTLARTLGVDTAGFWGFVDQPELAAICGESDIFVFPSLHEEFGFVLLEAMAAGLPCIASPHAGATHDLIRHGENGLVVDPDDRPAMTNALLSLAADVEMRRRLGAQARRDSRARTPRATAASYVAAVDAVLARKGKR